MLFVFMPASTNNPGASDLSFLAQRAFPLQELVLQAVKTQPRSEVGNVGLKPLCISANPVVNFQKWFVLTPTETTSSLLVLSCSRKSGCAASSSLSCSRVQASERLCKLLGDAGVEKKPCSSRLQDQYL